MRRRFFSALLPVFFVFSVILISGKKSWADDADGLTQEEKAEKRLQFNQFVEQQLAADAKAKAKAAKKTEAAPPEKNWSVTFTPSYGYDRNVDLDSHRKGDTYYEESGEARIKMDHPGIFFFGPGSMGLTGGGDLFNYERKKDANYRQIVCGAYIDSKLTEKISLKFNYDLTSLDYTHDDQLGYLSHRFKPQILYAWNQKWTQFFYSSFEYKDYSSRKTLSGDGSSADENRQDLQTEYGTGFRFVSDRGKVFGVTGAYRRNDASDAFNDFNDYEGPKVSGYAYFQLPAGFSTIFYGGYDYKKYSGRTFIFGSDRRQADSFFYAGNTLYYDLTPSAQIYFSYLYKQNYSNDSSQGYSDYVLSSGLTFTI